MLGNKIHLHYITVQLFKVWRVTRNCINRLLWIKITLFLSSVWVQILWLWRNYLCIIKPSLSTCKMEIIIVYISKHCWSRQNDLLEKKPGTNTDEPQFSPQDAHGRRGEWTTASYHLTSTFASWHASFSTPMQINYK